MAILSERYQGRSACLHCGFCQYFGCEVRAKSSTLTTVIRDAEKTGRCEIRPNSYVRKIEIDKAGRIAGVIYFDESGREVFQKAKAVVLCANGAETPRLLLLSKSNLFPKGLANSSGKVGKYLMFNGSASARALFEHPLNEFKSGASGAGRNPQEPERRLSGSLRCRLAGVLRFDPPRQADQMSGEANSGRRRPEAVIWAMKLASERSIERKNDR